MATVQDLNELRYIVLLHHVSESSPDSSRAQECYLVGQWPEPELNAYAKDDHSAINLQDSVYYSSEMTHAKAYRSMDEAHRDVKWLTLGRDAWKTNIMAVHAKIFFVADLRKDKWS